MKPIFIRSFHHLCKSLTTTPQKAIMIINGDYVNCQIFGVCRDNKSSIDSVLIFQNIFGDRNIPLITNFDNNNNLIDLLNEYSYCFWARNNNIFNDLQVQIILLHENFDNEYEAFLKQNTKLFQVIFSNYARKDDARCKYVYIVSEGSPNIFHWAIMNMAKNSVVAYIVIPIIKWCAKYPQLVKKLSKSTPTAYSGRDQIFLLYNEFITLQKEKKANDVINMFNTSQKKILKGLPLSGKNLEILNKFSILSFAKKQNFIRKMSTVTDVTDIMHQMQLLTKVHYTWSKKDFLEYINSTEGMNLNVVYEKDDVILVQVLDYDTIKYVAKTTNWCISKNKRYWNDYIGNRHNTKQYIVFDFSKKEDDDLSIIGFTAIDGKGIVNAHSFTNVNLMNSDMDDYSCKKFLYRIPNINSLLNSLRIPVNDLLFNKHFLNFEWNRDGLLHLLSTCMTEDDYDVICDDIENGKFAFITHHGNLQVIVGREVNRYRAFPNQKIIVFFDFKKQISDNDRQFCAFVENISQRFNLEAVFTLLDGSMRKINCDLFDDILKQFNLPYNIICRNENDVDKFLRALRNYNFGKAKSILDSNKSIVDEIKKVLQIPSQYDMNGLIENSILGVGTLDIINFLKDNGIQLSYLLTERQYECLLLDLTSELNGRSNFLNNQIPTYEKLVELYEHPNRNSDYAFAIALFFALNIILDAENNADYILKFFLRCVLSLNNQFIQLHFCKKIIDKALDNESVMKQVIQYICTYKLMDLIRYINDKNPSKAISKCLTDNMKHYKITLK